MLAKGILSRGLRAVGRIQMHSKVHTQTVVGLPRTLGVAGVVANPFDAFMFGGRLHFSTSGAPPTPNPTKKPAKAKATKVIPLRVYGCIHR